jgi:amino acid transporter
VTTVSKEPNPDGDRGGHPVATGILAAFGSVIGFIVGAGLIAAGGVIGSLGMSESGSLLHWLPAAVFIVLAVAGIAGAVYVLRQPGRGRLFAGFLIGVGVASLCEGICFSALR